MDTIYLPTLAYQCITCLGALIGLGVGVFIISRRHTNAGILALIGFLLIGLNPVVSFILWGPLGIINMADIAYDSYEMISWVDTCLAGGGLMMGCILVAVALVMAIRPAADEYTPTPPSY
jgi:hypothetical protein